ncbi:hypothetical protein KC614_04030 [candidate division WWE3 bacterium]|uniref:PEP-utilising enzyme mobile domain-containing protein n=1 Tax=candidate division WWE3 bacterium TaxID=2053526 RepID=A0A955LL11_UNCKA|nr:hypothetical protein [candidate division WWE3 bacterium]
MKKEDLKLSGLPACYGEAVGTVVFVRSQDDLVKVDEQSIVVTDKLTSEYTEAYIKAAGVITQTGGVTCHAAIVCREYQTPCIVSCRECFDVFQEGESIEIDSKLLLAKLLNKN